MSSYANNLNLPCGHQQISRILFTSTSLKTHNDLKNTATVADVVYLDDPETDQAAHAYIVFDKANWRRNSGMKLLSTHGEYLIIRKEKVSL